MKICSTGSDSQSQSLGKVSSEAKLSFVNEKKSIELENARKASVERKKKILKGELRLTSIAGSFAM